MVRIILAIVIAGVIVAAAMGVGAWWHAHERSRIETHEVGTGPLLSGVTVSGSVRCWQQAAISAEILASVRRLPVGEGQRVAEGDVLIELDDRIVVAQTAQAQAQVRVAEEYLRELQSGLRPDEIEDARQGVTQAQARHALVAQEHANIARMFAGGGATQSELDNIVGQLRIAEASLRQAEARLRLQESGTRPEQIARAASELDFARAEVRRSEALQDKYLIRAPHDGTVTARYLNIGEVVSPGQVLLQLDNTQAVEIRAAAQETQLAGIEPGARAEVVADAWPDMPFHAIVEQILPRVSQETGTVEVVLRLDEMPPRVLMDGMAVDVSFIRHRLEQTIRVPVDALSGPADATVVYVRAGRSWQQRPVRTGVRDGRWVQIVSGLEGGEVVRLH